MNNASRRGTAVTRADAATTFVFMLDGHVCVMHRSGSVSFFFFFVRLLFFVGTFFFCRRILLPWKKQKRQPSTTMAPRRGCHDVPRVCTASNFPRCMLRRGESRDTGLTADRTEARHATRTDNNSNLSVPSPSRVEPADKQTHNRSADFFATDLNQRNLIDALLSASRPVCFLSSLFCIYRCTPLVA